MERMLAELVQTELEQVSEQVESMLELVLEPVRYRPHDDEHSGYFEGPLPSS